MTNQQVHQPNRHGRDTVTLPFPRSAEPATFKWAEDLILQLPEHHNGRNSWLLNFGLSDEAKIIQEIRRQHDEANSQFGVGA